MGNTLPQALPGAELFLLDPALAPAERLERLRSVLRSNLETDLARWLDGLARPVVLDELLSKGWTIDTKFAQGVPRDWQSLVALAFVEKLKTDTRLSRVFEAKLLAQVAAGEPRAAGIATFDGFTGQLGRLAAPLERIEDSLQIALRDLAEVKSDVQEVKGDVKEIKGVGLAGGPGGRGCRAGCG